MPEALQCFTAYDVRGKIPEELNIDIARQIAVAFCRQIQGEKLVVGRDMRLSSPELSEAIIDVLLSIGVDVIDIGLCGTEEMYFAVFDGENDGVSGGIVITASHNPAEYNGMKFVSKGARPMSADSGLNDVARNAASVTWFKQQLAYKGAPGTCYKRHAKNKYIDHLLSIGSTEPVPLKIVVNSGNGCAGSVIDLLEQSLPYTFIKLHHQPDGNFPNGVPNPLLPEKREATANAVQEHGADLGIAWDGDFDRCFFYDETGRFIEGYYMVGILSLAMLKLHPKATILHDPRLIWNTQEMVKAAGGCPVMTKTGHAFIKEAMRRENAVYGGEMSAHHYFRDFGYCDTGMLPWLLVAQLMSEHGKTLSSMVNDMMESYPVSGEINSTVADPDAVIRAVEAKYADGAKEYTDGLSVSYSDYRFNVRKSNTEPVLRLNVETRGNKQLLREKTDELLTLIRSC